jgi:hypothetical protein
MRQIAHRLGFAGVGMPMGNPGCATMVDRRTRGLFQDGVFLAAIRR